MGENRLIFPFSGDLLLTEYIDYVLPLYPAAVASVISLYQTAAAV